jgi:hypothetical protein
VNLALLKELPSLGDIFQALSRGYHISAEDPVLYRELAEHEEAYRTLFDTLGFTLEGDPAGFYYFRPSVADSATKPTQKMAVFTFVLVEYLADKGFDPYEKMMDGILVADLPHGHREYADITRQAEIDTPESFDRLINTMQSLGFLRRDGGLIRFKSPIRRFLNLCIEFSKKGERPGAADDLSDNDITEADAACEETRDE